MFIRFQYGLTVNFFLKAIDMDMPFGYPRISIPGLTHYGGGLAQGLEYNLEMMKEGSNPYSTRTLVKP
jgi:hypothetical protein